MQQTTQPTLDLAEAPAQPATTASNARASKKPLAPAATLASAQRQALTAAKAPGGPDFVAALFDILCERKPDLAAQRPELEGAVRHHFGNSRQYVSSRPGPDEVARSVLASFNGRNAREVARRLGISRATVYRVLKQAGQR